MKTIADCLRDAVLDTPFLEEALAEGLVNLSALARKLRPEIEARLRKPVSETAVSMALRRLAPSLPAPASDRRSPLRHVEDLTVRSGLAELTYAGSASLVGALRELLREASDSTHRFVTFTQGVFEVTVILDAHLEPIARRILAGENLIAHLEGLAAVTLRLSLENIGVPGVHYSILKQLALRGINIIEVVSTYTELTIILDRQDVDRAFSVLLRAPLRSAR